MKSKIEIIEGLIAKTHRRIETVGELYLSDEIDRASYKRRLAIAERELDELERQLSVELIREDEELNWMAARRDDMPRGEH